MMNNAEKLYSYSIPADSSQGCTNENSRNHNRGGKTFSSVVLPVVLAVFLVAPWFAIADLNSKVEKILDKTDPVRQLGIKKGDRMPDGMVSGFEFLLKAPENGKQEKISEIISGKPSLFIFWSPYCSACVPKLAEIAEKKDELPYNKINIVAVTNQSIPAPSDEVEKEQFLSQFPEEMRKNLETAEKELSLKVEAPDEKGETVSGKIRVSAVPLYVAVDSEGIIKAVTIGDFDTVKKELDKLVR